MEAPFFEEQPLTLNQLLNQSGLKSRAIGKALGYPHSTTWLRKRENMDSWTTQDVKRLAVLIGRTPLEIFRALYYESHWERIEVKPAAESIPSVGA